MIGVVGLGHVGLTVALGFAEHGQRVLGFDHDLDLARALGRGEIRIGEPDLPEVLRRQLGRNFELAPTLHALLAASEIVFCCTGTPLAPDGGADISSVEEILQQAARSQPPGSIFVIKSTVPPGTTEALARKVGGAPAVAMSPEFLREGFAFRDFMRPDRIVIGAKAPAIGGALRALHACFGAPIHCVSPTTAECVKYASNALLATLISFSNEVGAMAEGLADVALTQVFRILHEDHRFSGSPAGLIQYVYPGAGFGGPCLPKDLRALVHAAAIRGAPMPLLEQVLAVNEQAKRRAVERVRREAGLEESVGVLGLSFKPGSADLRGSPSVELVSSLLQQGYEQIWTYDPACRVDFASPRAKSASSLEELVAHCAVLVIATPWPELEARAPLLNSRRVIDLRYFLDQP